MVPEQIRLCIDGRVASARPPRHGRQPPLFSAKAGRSSRVRQRASSRGARWAAPVRAAQTAPLLALDELTYAHPVLAVSKKRFNCVCLCVCSVIIALRQQIPEDLPATARVLIGHLRQEIRPVRPHLSARTVHKLAIKN